MPPSTKVKRKRDRLSPKPVLDQKLLTEALEAKGIYLKQIHIDTFYQLLHRQNYPNLQSFVAEYYRNENASKVQSEKIKIITIDSTSTHSEKENDPIAIQHLPRKTKNPISKSISKKNIRRLPRTFLEFLNDPNNDFVTLTSSIQSRPTSQDGTTTKMAVQLQDGHVVESVLMRHVSEEGSRATLCVSSQVGCAMGCTFCATGTMGIRGNLCTGEILEQLVHAGSILAEEYSCSYTEKMNTASTTDVNVDTNADVNTNVNVDVIVTANGKTKKKSEQNFSYLRNIVFMGMGEPLNNYDNVIAACRAMIDRRRWNLAHGRVTVSTVGVTPKMRQLTKDLPEVNLALSLHAPNQPMREAIVPTAKMYPIQDMVDALDEHMTALLRKSNGNGNDKDNDGIIGAAERKSISKKKRAMIEYVMLKGDTSTFECAHQLGKLCENRQLVVNLIPYNQTDVKDKLSCPSEEHMKEFQRIVTSYGSFCTIRRTMGADIAGACGQLVVAKEKEREQGRNIRGGNSIGDIEDGPFGAKVQGGNVESKKTIVQKSKQSETIPKKETEVSKDYITGESDLNDLDRWIKPLAYATTAAASFFVLSLAVMVLQRRKR